VVTEAGSALYGKRLKFLILLRDPAVTRVVAGHRERFARFGSGYAGAVLSAPGCRLLVMDPGELDEHLVRDVTQILASLCPGSGKPGDRCAQG
jgi:predicted site-specific integrase-resolvase